MKFCRFGEFMNFKKSFIFHYDFPQAAPVKIFEIFQCFYLMIFSLGYFYLNLFTQKFFYFFQIWMQLLGRGNI